MPITTLLDKGVLQWSDTAKEWKATTVLGGVEASTIIAGAAAQGNVLYFNGSKWARLAPGTSGQLLKTQGASANPVWATVTPTYYKAQTTQYSLNESVTAGDRRTVYTFTLPGGTLGANGIMRCTWAGSLTTGVDKARFEVRFNTQNMTFHDVLAPGIFWMSHTTIVNRNSESSQLDDTSWAEGASETNAVTRLKTQGTNAIDTSADVTVTFAIENVGTTGTITAIVEYVLVEILVP